MMPGVVRGVHPEAAVAAKVQGVITSAGDLFEDGNQVDEDVEIRLQLSRHPSRRRGELMIPMTLIVKQSTGMILVRKSAADVVSGFKTGTGRAFLLGHFQRSNG